MRPPTVCYSVCPNCVESGVYEGVFGISSGCGIVFAGVAKILFESCHDRTEHVENTTCCVRNGQMVAPICPLVCVVAGCECE